MARPQKWKRVHSLPPHAAFVPSDRAGSLAVVMTVDEYETIRLIDYEGLTQEECAGMMQVARASVQSIYARARRKLSVCLVQGKELKIEGGAFLLEEQPEPSAQMPESDVSAVPCGKTVRIAVPVDASRTSVAASFARSDGFLVVEGGVRTFHGNPLSFFHFA